MKLVRSILIFGLILFSFLFYSFELNSQVQPCENAVQCYTKDLDLLEQARSEIATTEKKLKSDYESLNNQISQLQNDLENKNTNINNKLQEEVDSLRNEIQSLKNNIENGNIIAQKAVMVQARDVNHWFRHHYVDTANNDVFSLWRTDDIWFDLIRVQNASRLHADNVSDGIGLVQQGDMYVFTISPTQRIDLGPGGICYYENNQQLWCVHK